MESLRGTNSARQQFFPCVSSPGAVLMAQGPGWRSKVLAARHCGSPGLATAGGGLQGNGGCAPSQFPSSALPSLASSALCPLSHLAAAPAPQPRGPRRTHHPGAPGSQAGAQDGRAVRAGAGCQGPGRAHGAGGGGAEDGRGRDPGGGPRGRCPGVNGPVPPRREQNRRRRAAAEPWTAAAPSAAPSAWSRCGSR